MIRTRGLGFMYGPDGRGGRRYASFIPAAAAAGFLLLNIGRGGFHEVVLAAPQLDIVCV